MIHPDDEGFHYSTDAEWDAAAAIELGAADPRSAWVLTDRDCWHANPFYVGPPVPHPESDPDDFEYPFEGGAEPEYPF